MLQALADLGFADTCATLRHESGVSVQSADADALCDALLRGRWADAEQCATRLLVGVAVAAEEALARVRFWIAEQQFLELLECGADADALALLRDTLAVCAAPELVPRVHLLASFVLARDAAELRLCVVRQLPRDAPPSPLQAPAVVSIDTTGESEADTTAALHWQPLRLEKMADRRRHALELVRQCVPVSLMMPARRLDALLAQAIDWQLARCATRNDASVDARTASLLVDHDRSGERRLPSAAAVLSLERHRDEVWHVAFSPDGSALASASKDGTVIVWSVAVDAAASGAVSLRYRFTQRAHSDAVAFVQWSGDGQRLLSFANNGEICVFDADTGKLRHSFLSSAIAGAGGNVPTPPALAAIGACCWLDAACECVALAGSEHDVVIVRVSDASVQHTLRCGRVVDMAVSLARDRLVVITQAKQILVYRISALEQQPTVVQERAAMTSLQLSPDGRCALVCVPQAVHEWDLDQQRLVRAYRGQRQSRFVIRTCFGGARDAFVASGSEDAHVYIWARANGALLARLVGHTGVVNAVSWNARHVGMLASASDDHTVRIWLPAQTAAHLVAVRRTRRKSITK
jgi:WD40 repeat protein